MKRTLVVSVLALVVAIPGSVAALRALSRSEDGVRRGLQLEVYRSRAERLARLNEAAPDDVFLPSRRELPSTPGRCPDLADFGHGALPAWSSGPLLDIRNHGSEWVTVESIDVVISARKARPTGSRVASCEAGGTGATPLFALHASLRNGEVEYVFEDQGTRQRFDTRSLQLKPGESNLVSVSLNARGSEAILEWTIEVRVRDSAGVSTNVIDNGGKPFVTVDDMGLPTDRWLPGPNLWSSG